jgi:hypothetical protein
MDSFKMLSNLAASMVGSKSTFTNQNSQATIMEDMTSGQYILFLVILLLLIIVVNYIGALLFNMSVVKIMPSVKPIDTLHFFILNIVLHMLFC